MPCLRIHRFVSERLLLDFQVPFSSLMSCLGQLAPTLLQQLFRLATIVVHRPEEVQRAVQPLLVVPTDDLPDDLPGVVQVLQLGAKRVPVGRLRFRRSVTAKTKNATNAVPTASASMACACVTEARACAIVPTSAGLGKYSP